MDNLQTSFREYILNFTLAVAVNTEFWFTGEGGRLYSIVFGLLEGEGGSIKSF